MDDQHKSKRRADLRLCAAMIGGSAVVAMVSIGLMVGHDHDGYPAATKSSSMTVGSTSTQTTPSNAPSVGVAKPLKKGPAPLPSEEAAAK